MCARLANYALHFKKALASPLAEDSIVMELKLFKLRRMQQEHLGDICRLFG